MKLNRLISYSLRLAVIPSLLAVFAADAQPTKSSPEAASLVEKAVEQRQKCLAGTAMKILDEAIEKFPNEGAAYYFRAKLHDERSEWPQALSDCSKAIELNVPQRAACHQMRGEIYFRLNRAGDSVAEFDRYLESVPSQKPYHWQRGISLYYAGRFEEGQKQFEMHQSVNTQDVENAVWHFLCAAKITGVEKARSMLIPISADSRVPMAEVHELYRGKGTEEKVLEACKKGDPNEETRNQRLFYAHLYLGLYEDALGNKEAAFKHLSKAVKDYEQLHYMGDVARVHLEQIKQRTAR